MIAEEGATFNLGSNTQVVGYGPITAVGSQQNPVRFQRLTPSQAWKEVSFLANGNYFENVVLDGGTSNVVVASRSNTLRNVRSKNGWRNLSSWYDQAGGGGRSQVYVENSIFEASTSVGLVLQHIDADLQSTNVVSSYQAGLYVANAYPRLGGSLIESNGPNGASTDRSGIEVLTGGYVSLSNGNNRIRNNALHEISITGSGNAQLAMENSISDSIDPCSSSERLVYNTSGNTISAQYNYWGSSYTSTCFYTNVDTSWPYTWDPTYNPGAGSNVPSMVNSGEPDVLASGESSTMNSVDAERLAETQGEVHPRPTAEDRRLEMQTIRAALDSKSTLEDPAQHLRALHSLMLWDYADGLGEHQANLAALRRWSDRLLNSPSAHERGAAEVAASLEVWEALRAEQYSEAEKLVSGYLPAIQGAEAHEAMTMQRVALLERTGDYSEALDLIALVKATQSSLSQQRNEGESALAHRLAMLETREETLHQRIISHLTGAREAGGRDVLSGAFAAKEDAQSPDLPAAFEIAVLPNPFHQQTTLRYLLPHAAHVTVEVYNVLGQRVALLRDEEQGEGTYNVTFEAQGLSSGVYLYRIRAGSETRVGTMMLAR